MKRVLLLSVVPLALAACSSKAPPPEAPADAVTPALEALAAKAQPGTLGIAVMDLATRELRGVNADRPMPMQSVFKLPLAIVVLDAVDRGQLSLDDKVTLTKEQLSVAHSPIADAFPGKSDYTVEELVRAAVAQSDNSAADILMKRIGGPAAVTQFFQRHNIPSFRLDRYEYELQPQLVGLPEFKGQWIGMKAFDEAQAAVPVETQRASLRIYLADPRDRVTPADTVRLLALLADGKLLTPASTAKLMEILEGTVTGADRLKAGIPAGAKLFHKTGTGPTVDGVASATNDVGIIETPDGHRIAVAVYLAGSNLPPEQRAALIAEAARVPTALPAQTAAAGN